MVRTPYPLALRVANRRTTGPRGDLHPTDFNSLKGCEIRIETLDFFLVPCRPRGFAARNRRWGLRVVRVEIRHRSPADESRPKLFCG